MLSRVTKIAFLDELTKIGEDAEKRQKSPTWRRVAEAVIPASVGGGLGYGTALALEKAFGHTGASALGHTASGPSSRKILAAKMALGLLGAGSFMLADRYRKLMDNKLSGSED